MQINMTPIKRTRSSKRKKNNSPDTRESSDYDITDTTDVS